MLLAQLSYAERELLLCCGVLSAFLGFFGADGVFDYGFALDWMRKDLRICFEEAASNGSALPVTEIVDCYYEQLQELGLGRWDTSTLIHLLRQG